MPESKFTDDDIERMRRQAVSKRANVDYDKVEARRQILFAARTDSPEEFQTRMTNRGIDLHSEQGRRVMETYWTIRRALQR
ncbi:MAG TPA: hypothetical protein VIJ79_04010 [Acidobacteriaceae bacterium]